MPVFDLSQPSAFDHPIQMHNAYIQNLMDTREKFTSMAGQFRDFLFQHYPLTTARTSYKPHQALAAAHWENVRQMPSDPVLSVFDRTDTSSEGKACFDPWNGWWKGKWHSRTQSFAQRHIWDVTQPKITKLGTQYIQPVTQRTPKAGSGGYVHGGNLHRAWKRSRVNLAINVYSSTNGVTGWVSRREDKGAPSEVPHLGLLLNPHTLIWIAQFRPTSNPNIKMNEDFLMFFEWVQPDKLTYGVHGRRFRIEEKASTETEAKTGKQKTTKTPMLVPVGKEGWSAYTEDVSKRRQPPGDSCNGLLHKILKDTAEFDFPRGF